MLSLSVSLLVLAAPPRYDEEISAALQDVQRVYVVPAALVKAVIQTESAWNPRALSSCGAIGLMQVMPFNAVKLGLDDEKQLWVPRLNILAGVRLLAALLRHYEGDVVAALVAYNAGPRTKEAGVPSNGETPAYVVSILKAWKQYDVSPDAGVAPAGRGRP